MLTSIVQAVKDIFFCYMESSALQRLNEMSGGKATDHDLNALRDYCIDGLDTYVEGMIEKYLDDKALEVKQRC